MAGIDRRLRRASPAARVHMGVVGALAVIYALLVLAQAVLLAEVIARGAFGGATAGDLSGEIAALLGVTVARAIVSGGFELAGSRGGCWSSALARARPSAPARWLPPRYRAWTRSRRTSPGTCRSWRSRPSCRSPC